MKLISKVIYHLKKGDFFKLLFHDLKKRFFFANVFYPFSIGRVMTKNYLSTIPKINGNHYALGNYYLDSRKKLNRDSVVYSLGILREVSFDSAISQRYDCDVWMYDPTPACIEFMQTQINPHFRFFPLGVWTENTVLKFFLPENYGASSSAMYGEGNNYFVAEVVTMKELISRNQHHKIDVFKADIEGAALPILEQMIASSIFPEQIVVEFERPIKDFEKIIDFFSRVSKIRSALMKEGFEEFQLPRSNAKYYSIELLFVKITS